MSPRSWADDGGADDGAAHDGAAHDGGADEEPFWRTAAPARPRPVSGGIRINSTRAATRTPWSARFLAVVEASVVGSRLARGRTYARRGQTLSLEIDAGAATARVQGSAARPYRVRIGMATLGKAQWSAVLDALAADASLAAALLAGELPSEVEETFAAQGLALLPSAQEDRGQHDRGQHDRGQHDRGQHDRARADRARADLTMDCTCPDASVPCKHLAAVFYLLAERFDTDPFALLALRGRDRDTVLEELRARRTRTADATAPLPLDAREFYTGPGLPQLPVGPRTPADALLAQVPALPVAVRGRDAVELLRPLYRSLGDDAPPLPDT